MSREGDVKRIRVHTRTRIDKKKQIKATIPIDLKDALFRIRHVTRTPVKDVCEYLVHELLFDHKTYVTLNEYMHHTIRLDDSTYRGHSTNPQISKHVGDRTDRVTINFKRDDYDAIYNLSYALAISPSRTVGLLLGMAMADLNIVNGYVKEYLKDNLNDGELKELKLLLRYVNNSNPDHLSWMALLTTIRKKGSAMLKIREIIQEFLSDR